MYVKERIPRLKDSVVNEEVGDGGTRMNAAVVICLAPFLSVIKGS